MAQIDKVDLQILDLLQENGRISQHDLAKAVGLSAPAVGERLRKLEEREIIRQFTAVLDPRRLGWDILAFIFVGINGSRHFQDFRQRVAEIAKIRAANTHALEQLLAEIQSWPGIQWTTTSIVLSTLKETSSLPLPVPSDGPGGHEEAETHLGTADLLHVPFRHHP